MKSKQVQGGKLVRKVKLHAGQSCALAASAVHVAEGEWSALQPRLVTACIRLPEC
jgi:hypothetical protein